MNTIITINGNDFNKVEFFDYVFDNFVEADWSEPDSVANQKMPILYAILDTLHLREEYRQWVADGAGTKEAEAELRQLLNANPVA